MHTRSSVKPGYPANLIGDILLLRSVTVTPERVLGLESALEALSREEKTALLKRYRECKTYDAIAKEMSLPRTIARRQVETGLRKLRRYENRSLFCNA